MRPFFPFGRTSFARSSFPFAAVLLSGLSGCGAYWDIAEDEELAYGCSGALNWYPDCDRDGFGEPTGVPIAVDCESNLDDEDVANAGCQVVEGERLPLASNAIDCDPADGQITARTGICPESIGEGEYLDPYSGEWTFVPTPSSCVRGFVAGDTEYLATCEGSPPLTAQRAATSCELWAGSLLDASKPEVEGYGGLARLRTPGEGFATFLSDLEAQNVRALWLDLSWDHQNDAWNYQGDSELGNVPIDFPPCAGPAPSLEDIWVEVNPTALFQDLDEDGVPDRVEREVGTDPNDPSSVEPNARGVDRLALVKPDGGDWCWGPPGRFDLDPRLAYTLCQRPLPKPEVYSEAPVGQGQGG